MNLKLRELKRKTPKELLEYAEELGVENASSMRTQDMLFSILKNLAADKKEIDGEGVLEGITRWFWIFKIYGSKLSSRSR
jgi:transcription termination factor Rho